MHLQQFNLSKGVHFTIVTPNITHGSPLKVLIRFETEKVLLTGEAAVQLFSGYSNFKQHFNQMTFMGHVDYIVNKDYDNGMCVCITAIKYLDETDANRVKRRFEMRFYDVTKKTLLIIPCGREVLRFLESRRQLLVNGLEFWDHKMALILAEDACQKRTNVNRVSLQFECKRTLLLHTPCDHFLPDEKFKLLPRVMRYYMITWQDHGIGYLPTSEDTRPIGADIDRDEDF